MAHFDITVTRTANGDLAKFETATNAPEMEDRVTALHREFPAPEFRVDVDTPRPADRRRRRR